MAFLVRKNFKVQRSSKIINWWGQIKQTRPNINRKNGNGWNPINTEMRVGGWRAELTSNATLERKRVETGN